MDQTEGQTDRQMRVISYDAVLLMLSVQNLINACMIMRKVRNSFMDSYYQHLRQAKNFYMFLFHHLLPFDYVFTFTVGNQISNKKCLTELIKRRAKVHQRIMSQERSLDFDQ